MIIDIIKNFLNYNVYPTILDKMQNMQNEILLYAAIEIRELLK